MTCLGLLRFQLRDFKGRLRLLDTWVGGFRAAHPLGHIIGDGRWQRDGQWAGVCASLPTS